MIIRQSKIFGYTLLIGAIVAMSSYVLAQKPRRTRTVVVPPQSRVSQQELKELSETAAKSRQNLIDSSKTYRESLERLLGLQKSDEERAGALVEKNQKLLDMGVISKRELEESRQSFLDAEGKTRETQRQIESVDHLVAEVIAAEQLAKMPAMPAGAYRATSLLIKYVGASRWAMSDITKIDAFFRLKFSRVLPVSAFGQSDTHTRLGFDHHDAIDVAVHPDSAEGQELITYLRSQRLSFIAIRGAIPGSATGAHIHIGPPSKKIER